VSGSSPRFPRIAPADIVFNGTGYAPVLPRSKGRPDRAYLSDISATCTNLPTGGRSVSRILAVIFTLGALLAPLVGPAEPAVAVACQFTRGFATLHDQIPNIVGNCLENVRYNATTGDGLQMTTRGLLVWRKADNATTFTDGFRTWINGPFGLQTRLNSQRFAWEALDLAALKNATYTVQGPPNGVATLINGTFQVPAAPGSASKITVTLLDQPILFADFTGNGTRDAAVILSVETGGTGVFKYLAIVENQNGVPKNVATTFLGDRVVVQNLTDKGNGTIAVDMLVAGPGEPLCCPTQHVTQTYRLQDNQLVRVS